MNCTIASYLGYFPDALAQSDAPELPAATCNILAPEPARLNGAQVVVKILENRRYIDGTDLHPVKPYTPKSVANGSG